MWYDFVMEDDGRSDDKSVIEWEAKEYISQKKGAWWYVGLFLAVAILAGVAIWMSEADSWSFIALLVVAAVALVIYSNREPKMVRYELTKRGIREGGRFYDFSTFKSFGILEERGSFAVVLMPRKRFALSATIYFPEEKGEQIVDFFGKRLPMEAIKLDLFDKIARILRI
jgi:hypothetical protein